MQSSPPDAGQRLLVLTLEMETAAASANWPELAALGQNRAELLAQLSDRAVVLDGQMAERINVANQRIARSLSERKKKIARDLGNLAKFRKSLMAALAAR